MTSRAAGRVLYAPYLAVRDGAFRRLKCDREAAKCAKSREEGNKAIARPAPPAKDFTGAAPPGSHAFSSETNPPGGDRRRRGKS